MTEGPLLYGELADWWPLMSDPADYAEEAAHHAAVLRERCRVEPKTLLELGSGGGNNAHHMKKLFEKLTLVDLSPGMLEVSRELNPLCEHILGDMWSVRLERTFDCVFVHDAVCYATTLDDLRRVAATAFVHLAPGGTALFVPDFVRETFEAGTGKGGHDGRGRGLRYLSWTRDPDPGDTTYEVDYAFLLRERDGSVRIRHDRHTEGLFSTDDWTRVLAEAGFEPEVHRWKHSEVQRELVSFVGTRE